MRIIYKAEDGMHFDTKDACLAHEGLHGKLCELFNMYADPSPEFLAGVVMYYKDRLIEILTADAKPSEITDW